MRAAFDREELINDFGEAGLLKLIAAMGGMTRYVPSAQHAERSKMASEIGIELTLWLSARFGGEEVRFPTLARRQSHELRDAVLAAGLTDPTRSANDIAREFGVGVRHVEKLRTRLRVDLPDEGIETLPLFRKT
jgi:hypothetical protein